MSQRTRIPCRITTSGSWPDIHKSILLSAIARTGSGRGDAASSPPARVSAAEHEPRRDRGSLSDLLRSPFEREAFPFSFLAAFGNKPATIAKLKGGASNGSDLPGGVLQRNHVHLATCDVGAVSATFLALKDSAATKTTRNKVRFLLATDGQTVEAEDLTSGETVACAYPDLADHFGFFLPLAGFTTVKQVRESAFDVRATGRLNRLYLQLLKENPEWAHEARRHDMNHFMARLIFCFFAEDTDIFFGNGLFTDTVRQMSAGDASNTHEVIGTIFRAMNVKTQERTAGTLPRWAEAFPYVNGGLFSGSTEVPRFSRIARSYLLHIGALEWRRVNPDISAR